MVKYIQNTVYMDIRMGGVEKAPAQDIVFTLFGPVGIELRCPKDYRIHTVLFPVNVQKLFLTDKSDSTFADGSRVTSASDSSSWALLM